MKLDDKTVAALNKAFPYRTPIRKIADEPEKPTSSLPPETLSALKRAFPHAAKTRSATTIAPSRASLAKSRNAARQSLAEVQKSLGKALKVAQEAVQAIQNPEAFKAAEEAKAALAQKAAEEEAIRKYEAERSATASAIWGAMGLRPPKSQATNLSAMSMGVSKKMARALAPLEPVRELETKELGTDLRKHCAWSFRMGRTPVEI